MWWQWFVCVKKEGDKDTPIKSAIMKRAKTVVGTSSGSRGRICIMDVRMFLSNKHPKMRSVWQMTKREKSGNLKRKLVSSCRNSLTSWEANAHKSRRGRHPDQDTLANPKCSGKIRSKKKSLPQQMKDIGDVIQTRKKPKLPKKMANNSTKGTKTISVKLRCSMCVSSIAVWLWMTMMIMGVRIWTMMMMMTVARQLVRFKCILLESFRQISFQHFDFFRPKSKRICFYWNESETIICVDRNIKKVFADR